MSKFNYELSTEKTFVLIMNIDSGELISDEFYIRCEEAEISWPCIVVENASNPDDKKYRMMDGRHRMYKMKELNIDESIFYVLELKIFNKHLKKSYI